MCGFRIYSYPFRLPWKVVGNSEEKGRGPLKLSFLKKTIRKLPEGGGGGGGSGWVSNKKTPMRSGGGGQNGYFLEPHINALQKCTLLKMDLPE